MQRKAFALPLMVLVYFCLTLMLAGGPGGDQSAARGAHVLPADTLLYIEVSGPRIIERLRTVQAPPLAQIVYELGPRNKQLITDSLQLLDEALTLKSGTSSAALRGLKSLHLGLVATDGEPVPVLVLQLASSDAVRQVLAARTQADAPAARLPVRLAGGKTYAVGNDNCLIFAGSTETLERLPSMQGEGAATLGEKAAFKEAEARTRSRSPVWAYLDVRALFEEAAEHDKEGMREVGLDTVEYATFAVQGSQDSPALEVFVGLSEGESPLLRLIQPGQNLSILDAVPSDAYACVALSLGDTRALWQEIYAVAARADGDDFAERVAAFEQQFGIGIEDDLLAPLTGQAAAFITPVGQLAHYNNFTILVELSDPDRMRQTLARVWQLTPPQLIVKEQIGGVEVNRIKTVSFFIKDNIFVLTGSRDALDAYLARPGGRPAKSITHACKLLAPARGHGNVAIALNGGYLMSFLTSDAPPGSRDDDAYNVLHLTMTQEGLTCTLSATGRPGGLPVQNLAVPALPIMAAIMLPALRNTRRQASETVSMNNLKQVGLALAMYAQDHDGNWPDRLGDLMPDYLGDPGVLLSPSDKHPAPPPQGGPPSSYVYVGPLTPEAPVNIIIAYSRRGVDRWRCVLFRDCHVERIKEVHLRRRLAENLELLRPQLGDNMPPEKLKRIEKFYAGNQ